MSKSPETPPPKQWLYNPADTKTCTDAFYRFIVEYDDIIGLFLFITTSAARMDEMQAIAAHALADQTERQKPFEVFNKRQAFGKVQKYARLLSRDLVVSMANNFQSYLSEVLQEVMSKRHEVLRSSERITTEDALQFNRLKDLRSFIADRKINELSYGGLRQVQDFVVERFGIDMFGRDEERALLTIFVELRNIHTHNRGVVNQLFLNRIGPGHERFSFELGDEYQVDFDDFIVLSRNAIAVAQRLDDLLATKFKLRRSNYKKRAARERSDDDAKP